MGLGQNERTSQIKKLNGLIQELELETSKKNQNILEENFSLRLDSVIALEFNSNGYHRKKYIKYDPDTDSSVQFYYDPNDEGGFRLTQKHENIIDNNRNIVRRWYTGDNDEIFSYGEEYKTEFDSYGNQTSNCNSYNNGGDSFFPRQGCELYQNFYENGKLIKVITQRYFEENNSYEIFRKREYNYDGNNLLSEVFFNWDSITDEYTPSSKNEYYYENNSLTNQISYGWDPTSQTFLYLDKIKYIYDVNGNLVLEERMNWDDTSDSFFKNSYVESEFDTNNNKVQEIYYDWSYGWSEYIPRQKTYWSYDNDNNLTLWGYSMWSNNDWVLQMETSMTYDEYGFLDVTNGYYNNNGFEGRWKEDYLYDESGNLYVQQRFDSDWGGDSEILFPIWKVENSFNNLGLKNIETYSNWDRNIEVYKPTFKMEYLAFLETESTLVRKGILFEFDSTFSTWEEISGEEFESFWYYTKLSNLSNEIREVDSVTIYPNPTTSIVTLQGDKQYDIEVYTLQGKKVMALTGNTIDMSHLSSATYIVKALDKVENEEVSYKVVKN